jgi:hypothetical protein
VTTKSDLFEDIATALDSWTEVGVDATTNRDSDLQWTEDAAPFLTLRSAIETGKVDAEIVRHVLSECLRGFAVSILTILDGGTALAERGRLYVVDENGTRVGEGLHGDFVGHLIDAGRL